MYQPSYQITNKLLSGIVRLEVDKTKANQLDLNYDLRSKLTQQTKAENIFHLSNMLNLPVTLKEAEKLAEGKNLQAEDEKFTLVNNFRNVLEFNRSGVADSYVNLDISVVQHINKIVISGWKESWEVKIRDAGENPDSRYEGWIDYRDASVEPHQVTGKLNELFDWFHTEDQRVHGIIRVAVLIWRMVELHPFLAGNRFTIMAIADLLLYQYGFISTTYYPLVQNFDQNEQDYWKVWDLSRRNHDLTAWIEKFVSILAEDVHEKYVNIDERLSEQQEKNSSQPFLDLNKRQLKILRYLQNIPTVKREDYCQMMDVSTMTAYRDLNELVEKQLLKVEGKGRGTRYKLSSR